MNDRDQSENIRPLVYFVGLGCPKNQVDGEVILGYLKREGFGFTETPEDAEIILVNTCAFIQKATEEALETILTMAQLKESGACRRLIVTGCLPQRYGEELLDLLPEVDLFLGTGEITAVVRRLKDLDRNGSRACHSRAPNYLYTDLDPRIRLAPAHTAYVKIAEGCSNRCSYCAVPNIRGPLRSRTVESIVAEVRGLAAEGVAEVILVAQDTMAFGEDRKRGGELPELIRSLDKLDGPEWIRLLYGHPDHLSDAILEAFSDSERLVPYIDLPVQHASPRILKAMNRRSGPDDIKRNIDKARRMIPDLALRTSVIVGFPGETEEDYEQLLDFVEEVRFDWLGAFEYSQEEGTPAFDLAHPVDESVVAQRLQELMDIQEGITRERLGSWLDRVVPVLVEEPGVWGQGEYMGRAPFQSPEIDGVVHLKGNDITIGSIVPVRITDVLDYDLLGDTV